LEVFRCADLRFLLPQVQARPGRSRQRRKPPPTPTARRSATIRATVPESPPSSEPPDGPAALEFVSSKDGASPGNRTLVVSAVVVVDFTSVELVASCRVVAVVLLVLEDFAVEDVVVALGNVELVVSPPVELVVPAALTTTTPTMPSWP
jgi:hypothetical protein